MNKILLTTALGAALAAGPALALAPAVTTTKTVQPTPPSEIGLALTALGKEFKPLTSTMSGDMGRMLEKLEAHQYQEATRERLAKVFGDPDAFKLRRAAGGPGEAVYTMGTRAHSFTEEDGTRYSWSELGMTMALDPARRQMRSNGKWQSLTIESKDLSATLSGMALASQARRSPNDIWLGSARMTMDSASFAGKKSPMAMTLEELSVTTTVTPRAKVADLGYDFRIKTIKAAGEQVDGVRMALRFNGVDIKAFEAVGREGGDDVAGLTPQQQLDRMLPRIRKFGTIMVRSGASVDIQEISAGYKGNRAVVKGRVSMPGVREGDLKSMAAFVKKLHANIEIRVPVALIKAISETVARKQIQSQNKDGQPASEAAVAQAAQGMTDVVLGKALGQGYARNDKDVLVSRIEFRNGKLTVNGKAVSLPSPKAAAPAALPPPHDPTSMKAREISEGCARATLPDDLKAKGFSVRALAEVAVGADGKVRDVRIVSTSGSQEFDAAVLKAAAGCRWAPALAGGKEVEAKVVQQHHATPETPQAMVSTIGK